MARIDLVSTYRALTPEQKAALLDVRDTLNALMLRYVDAEGINVIGAIIGCGIELGLRNWGAKVTRMTIDVMAKNILEGGCAAAVAEVNRLFEQEAKNGAH